MYKYISMKYSEFLHFSQCENDALEESLVKEYQITNRPSVVLFKENSAQPVVISQTFNKESFENLVEEHKFLIVPEITMVNYNPICGKKSKYNYCAIIINRDNDGVFQPLLSKLRTISTHLDKVERLPRVKFGYIRVEFQQFINFFNITSDQDNPVLFFDTKTKRHLLYKEPIELDDLERFLRNMYISKTQFADTPRHIPLLMIYPTSTSFFDSLSWFASTPIEIIRTLLNHSMSLIVIIMILRCCRCI